MPTADCCPPATGQCRRAPARPATAAELESCHTGMLHRVVEATAQPETAGAVNFTPDTYTNRHTALCARYPPNAGAAIFAQSRAAVCMGSGFCFCTPLIISSSTMHDFIYQQVRTSMKGLALKLTPGLLIMCSVTLQPGGRRERRSGGSGGDGRRAQRRRHRSAARAPRRERHGYGLLLLQQRRHRRQGCPCRRRAPCPHPRLGAHFCISDHSFLQPWKLSETLAR